MTEKPASLPDEPGQILKETIALLRQGPPLPFSDITLENVVVSVFFTGVKLSTGYGGICFTPVDLVPQTVSCTTAASTMPYCGRMQGGSGYHFFGTSARKIMIQRA